MKRKSIFTIYVSLIFAITCLYTCTAFAEKSEFVTEKEIGIQSISTRGNTIHKTNGIGTEKGGIGSYTSTITRNCDTIKVQGICLGNPGDKTVVVTVYPDTNHNRPVAYGKVLLDGQYHKLSTMYVTHFSPGTYYIVISPYFSGGYDVSTFFCY